MPTTADAHHVIGSLGSDFWRIKVHPELVPAMAREFDWNRLGRRVMIDARKGIITWMNPSGSHVGQASASDKVVPLAGALLKIRIKDMRDLRWKGTGGPGNVWLEADAAYYIRKNAEGWFAARDKGRKEALAFEARTPPDLVVEVEVTRFDEDKPRRYAELGVPEMWRVYGERESDRFNVEILALQERGGPKAVEESRVLPGLPARILPEALELGELWKYRELKKLLAENLIPANNSKPDPESETSPPTPSM
ncbi:MAG: Uma2 family endonuclease [Paracoccaceae bacterium]|nr:Uma2 family endonuclease [Paracoccaceae bacterium]MDE2674484.1 Uma2 family endonuclease [Paracoccaceae bacterium]